MTQILNNLKTNIDKLTQVELVDLKFDVDQELKRRENDAKEEINKRITELLSEKNLLEKPVYTVADVCTITKAPRSLVNKVKEKLDEDSKAEKKDHTKY